MSGLTDKQIRRQDFVDNAIYDLIERINPTENMVQWNIEEIALIREALKNVVVQRLGLCDELTFYPFFED